MFFACERILKKDLDSMTRQKLRSFDLSSFGSMKVLKRRVPADEFWSAREGETSSALFWSIMELKWFQTDEALLKYKLA
jgi:hypothetical protein